MQHTSRRARRRSKAQVRDRYTNGSSLVRSPMGTQTAKPETYRMFNDARPKLQHSVKMSATDKIRTKTILQKIDAGRPYRKHTIRFRTVSEFNGVRVKMAWGDCPIARKKMKIFSKIFGTHVIIVPKDRD